MGMFTGDLSGKKFPSHEKVPARAVRGPVPEVIKNEHPHFTDLGCLSLSELNHYRHRFIESTVEQELGSLSTLEREVLRANDRR